MQAEISRDYLVRIYRSDAATMKTCWSAKYVVEDNASDTIVSVFY